MWPHPGRDPRDKWVLSMGYVVGNSHRDPKQVISSNLVHAREVRIHEHEATRENREKFNFSGVERAKRFYYIEIVKHSGQVIGMAITHNQKRFALTRVKRRGIPIA